MHSACLLRPSTGVMIAWLPIDLTGEKWALFLLSLIINEVNQFLSCLLTICLFFCVCGLAPTYSYILVFLSECFWLTVLRMLIFV